MGRWFDAYAARMVLYARQFVGPAAAEDLVQDVFVRLGGQKKEPGNVKAWLLKCVRNAGLDAVKMAARREARDANAGERYARAFERRAEDPLDVAEVEGMLERLPALQREVITLRIWGDVTYAEIAEIVGMPLTSVFQEYRSGLLELRTRLEPPCRKM